MNQIEILELKSTVTKMKKLLRRLHSRFAFSEERSSEFKDRVVEVTEVIEVTVSEELKEKRNEGK